jgi:hypothetical protein
MMRGRNLCRGIIGAALAATMAIGLGTNRAAAEDLGASCQAPDWDMAAEIARSRAPRKTSRREARSASLPPLELGVLYVLKLRPQTEVSYLQASNKKSLVQAPLGGLTSFAVAKPGVYRITVDSPLWIDVVGPARDDRAERLYRLARLPLVPQERRVHAPGPRILRVAIQRSHAGTRAGRHRARETLE